MFVISVSVGVVHVLCAEHGLIFFTHRSIRSWQPSYHTSFCCILVCAPKNRQIISGVFTFFKTLRAQNTINKCKYRCRRIPMFLAPRKPKTTVFTISWATGSKNNSICSVFGALPSKNTGIEWYWHDFQQLARSTFYLQKVQKHRNLWCSSFLSATKNRTTIVQKRSKLTSWSILFIYFSGFPEEFFWGGRSAPLAMLRGREERLWTTTVDGGVTARWRLFNSPYNWGSNRPFRHFRSKVQSHELSFSIYISSGEGWALFATATSSIHSQ